MAKKHREKYISVHDIDWFCKAGGFYIHIASFGGRIAEVDFEENEKIYKAVCASGELCDAERIEYPQKTRETITDIDAYYKSFEYMSKRGFYSFDRTDFDDNESVIYHLVSKPVDTRNAKSFLDRLQIIERTDEELVKSLMAVGTSILQKNFSKLIG